MTLIFLCSITTAPSGRQPPATNQPASWHHPRAFKYYLPARRGGAADGQRADGGEDGGCFTSCLWLLFHCDSFVLQKFNNAHHKVVLWMAMHAEDAADLFGALNDPLGVFNRFDWFARAVRPAKLEEYGDEIDQDSAVLFLADILQIIENQFPDLSKDVASAKRHDNYSCRTNLWRVSHKSITFAESFNMHVDKQGQAKVDGDEGLASFSAKMKTKSCRYALPVQSLCRAITEKLSLEQYRQQQMMSCIDNCDEQKRDEWKDKPILELRSEFFAKDAAGAKDLGMKEKRDLAFDEESETVSRLLSSFLTESNNAFHNWIAHRGKKQIPNSSAAKNGNGRPVQNDVCKRLSDIELDQALAKCKYTSVAKNAKVLLMYTEASFKLAAVQKKMAAGLELDVAVELLARAELLKGFSLKRPGATGPASLCFAKRSRDEDPVVSMRVQNMLRNTFGILEIKSFLCVTCDPSVGTAASNGLQFASVTDESLKAFHDKWGHVFAAASVPSGPLPSRRAPPAKRAFCSETFSQGAHDSKCARTGPKTEEKQMCRIDPKLTRSQKAIFACSCRQSNAFSETRT